MTLDVSQHEAGGHHGVCMAEEMPHQRHHPLRRMKPISLLWVTRAVLGTTQVLSYAVSPGARCHFLIVTPKPLPRLRAALYH